MAKTCGVSCELWKIWRGERSGLCSAAEKRINQCFPSLFLAGCDSRPASEKEPSALTGADHKAAFEKKLAAHRPKAEAGDPTAQLEVGRAYEEGLAWAVKLPAGDAAQKDPLIDLVKAAEWYEKAAIQGNAEAQYRLGMLWKPTVFDDLIPSDRQRPRDAAKAATWFEKAAQQDHAGALLKLGELYDAGDGVREDKWKAFLNFKRAAELGNPDAQFSVGLMYYWGAPQDPKGPCTHRYLSDDPLGLVPSGKGNYFDKFDSPFCLADKDPATAAVWWEKAAAQNDWQAQFNLAFLYRTGEGVAKNASRAFALYEAVAKLADKKGGFGFDPPAVAVDAQTILGDMCRLGEGTPKDDATAVEWYQKAASSGQTAAQQNLGVLYLRGEGIATDNVLAYAWSNLAASRGEDDAGKNRDSVARFMTPAEIAEAQRISSSWKFGQTLGPMSFPVEFDTSTNMTTGGTTPGS